MKALFLDLDGTLLNDEKKITEENRTAILRALEEGHKVIINTGRPLPSAILQAKALGMMQDGFYLIAYNGGVLYDLGAMKVISQTTLPRSLVCSVFDEANRRGLHIQTYDEKKVLVETRCDNETVRRYCSLIKMEHRVIESVQVLAQDPAKMLAIDFQNRETLIAFKEWLEASYGKHLDAFFSCNAYLEIVPKGMNKGNALLKMAELLHVLPEDTVAVGDEANDLQMIETAGTGVCMANGTAEAKAVADYITVRDNNNSGVAEVIEKLIIEKGKH